MAKARSTDPYAGLKVGDSVLLSSPLVDPVHWFFGEVLWRDDEEVLVQQHGIASQHPHKCLHDISYVRAFGTQEYCVSEKIRVGKVVRDAARMAQDVEETATDLRRKMVDLFEVVAAAALKACGDVERTKRSAP